VKPKAVAFQQGGPHDASPRSWRSSFLYHEPFSPKAFSSKETMRGNMEFVRTDRQIDQQDSHRLPLCDRRLASALCILAFQRLAVPVGQIGCGFISCL
jgi:hypothetical protein